MDIQEFHESMRQKYRERERQAERRRALYHLLFTVAVVIAFCSAMMAHWIVIR